MFWDHVAGVYDIFANVINRKANKALCRAVERLISPCDDVLECACGTGLLTGVIAPRCKHLVATDFSAKMLKRAAKKYKKYGKQKQRRFWKSISKNLPHNGKRKKSSYSRQIFHTLTKRRLNFQSRRFSLDIQ